MSKQAHLREIHTRASPPTAAAPNREELICRSMNQHAGCLDVINFGGTLFWRTKHRQYCMSTPIARSVLIYGCAFAIAGLTPFLLLPILTRYLSPHQFGEVTAFLILTSLLGNIAGLSAHGFVSVRFFKTSAEHFRKVVASSVFAVGMTHALAAVLVALIYPALGRALDLPFGFAMLGVAAALFLNLNLISLAIFQSSSQPTLYLLARLIQGLVEFFLCIALIFLVAADAGSRIYSYTVAIAVSATMGWLLCQRRGYIAGGIDRKHVKNLIAFGVPMLPHVVAGTTIMYLDRLVVSSVLGAESLGIYMASMQIGMAMIALIEPLNRALAPWLFAQLSKNDDGVRAMIVRRTYLLYAALALVGMIVAGAAHFFFHDIVGVKFAAARSLIPWMVAGFVLQGMYYSVVNYLFYAERTGRLSMVSGSTAVFGCLMSYLLTSAFGLAGASASFALNNAVLFLLVWFIAAKAVRMPWLPWRD